MRHESLSQEWYARERASPIESAMRFAPEGLVLGAGTLLLQTDAAPATKRSGSGSAPARFAFCLLRQAGGAIGGAEYRARGESLEAG